MQQATDKDRVLVRDRIRVRVRVRSPPPPVGSSLQGPVLFCSAVPNAFFAASHSLLAHSRRAKAGSKVSSSTSTGAVSSSRSGSEVVLNLIRGVCARCVGTGVSEPLGVSASSAVSDGLGSVVSGSLIREGEEHSRLLSSSVGVLSSSSFEFEASSRGMSFEGDEHAVLFGYLGAAAAMIFSCALLLFFVVLFLDVGR